MVHRATTLVWGKSPARHTKLLLATHSPRYLAHDTRLTYDLAGDGIHLLKLRRLRQHNQRPVATSRGPADKSSPNAARSGHRLARCCAAECLHLGG